MYDLSGADSPNEFVEIFNMSETDTIHLDGWTIADRLYTDTLEDSGDGLSVPPNGYGLIMEGDYDIQSGIYTDIIPENTIIIKVDDSSIGNGLSGSDSLFLYDSFGVLIDSLGWEDTVQDGYSLEKIRPLNSNEPYNWSVSLDSLGTPGSQNSVYPFEVDGAIVSNSITLYPSIIDGESTTTIMGRIVNVGFQSFESQIQISDNDSVVGIEYLSILSELDTADFELEIGPFSSGNHDLAISLILENDLNVLNNIDSISLGVRYEISLIQINEFYPQPNSNEPEFVELVYMGNDSININQWELADNRDNTDFRFPNITIGPLDYLVIADDSSFSSIVPDYVSYIVMENGFPTLNNSGDMIRLYDPFFTLIDSLSYQSNWGYSTGISVEKIFPELSSYHSDNWAPNSSLEGRSPGLINSVTPLTIDGTLIDSILTNPLYPNEFESFTLDVLVLNSGVNQFFGHIQILGQNQLLGSESFQSSTSADTVIVSINIDGLPSGIHPIQIDLSIQDDQNTDDNTWTDSIFVKYNFNDISINEFMAIPNNDQSEFIEVIPNRSINFFRWSLSDSRKNPIFLPDTLVTQDSYLILAADSLILNNVSPEATTIFLHNQFPSLNNGGDAIYIFDATGTIIDSLIYDNHWGMVSEISMEKLRPEFVSNNKDNWETANPLTGSTPGFENSKMLKNIDGSVINNSMVISPQFPEELDSISGHIAIFNNGVSPCFGSFYIEEGDEELTEVPVPIIEPSDTINIPFEISPLSSGVHVVSIFLDIVGDEQHQNDFMMDTILVSYPFGSVSINEFLSLTDTTKPEFVEIVLMDYLNLLDWGLSDISGKTMTFPNLELHKGSYLTLSPDSSILSFTPDSSHIIISENDFPNLNNTSDGLFIVDMTGKIIDSLIYDLTWPITENRSTEKFKTDYLSNAPTHWGISIAPSGFTPGEQNSLSYAELPNDGNIVLSPNPFSPDGDGVDDLLEIKFSLPFENSIIRIEIFDMAGRTIAQPFYNIYVGQNGVLHWDGRWSNGNVGRLGIYLVKTSAKDQVTGEKWEDFQTIVLAKKL